MTVPRVTDAWDDIVVGGGSAGCVLAARLAADASRRVLLVEAGPVAVPGADPAARAPLGRPILDGANWPYQAYLGPERQRAYPYRVGRVLGGSSAVNGAIALRAAPVDFNGWAAAGNPDWVWSQVGPVYERIGADLPVRVPTEADLDPLAAAFLDSCAKLGVPRRGDPHRPVGSGTAMVPSNAVGGRRISAAEAFLGHRPPNLTVWTDGLAHRVVFTGGRATGIEVRREGVLHRVTAGRVVLAAGAIGTPALLLRSGVGAAPAVRRLGLDVVADLPGVGAGLRDHPVIAVWAVREAGAGAAGGDWHQVMAHLAAAGERTAEVALFLASNVADADIPVIGSVLGGQPAASLATVLLRPRSTGTVTLSDPYAPPTVTLRLAGDDVDMATLAAGVRFAWDIIRTPPVAGLLRRPLVWTDRMVGDDRLLRDSIRRFVSPMLHPVGTARMGPERDPGAVVDQHGAVYGVDGLWVGDASVLPSMPGAPTNLTVMMVADRIAGWVR